MVCTVVPGATIGIPDSTYVIFEVLTPGSFGTGVVGISMSLGQLSGDVAPWDGSVPVSGFSLDSTGIGILTGGGYAFFPGVNNEDVWMGTLSDIPEPTPMPALDGHGLALLVVLLAASGRSRIGARSRWVPRQTTLTVPAAASSSLQARRN